MDSLKFRTTKNISIYLNEEGYITFYNNEDNEIVFVTLSQFKIISNWVKINEDRIAEVWGDGFYIIEEDELPEVPNED